MEPQGQLRRNAIPCKEHPASNSLVDRGIASVTELEVAHLCGVPVVELVQYRCGSVDSRKTIQMGARGEGLEC